MEDNRRSIASKEEEERGGTSALVGPSRRSLRPWARPAPYTPSPRRFVADFLSKPSPPIRSLLDTPRTSLPRLHDNASASTLERNQNSGNSTHQLLQENDIASVEFSEVAEIENYLKARTFSRDEAAHLVEVMRSRTPALNNVAALSITKSPNSIKSESKQPGLLAHGTITWKPGDSVYSKANALGCTPIEIAKAYMRDLSSSRADSGYQTKTSRDAENSFEKHDSNNKSRICWPGAILPGNNSSCSTPQSSRGNTVQDATPSRTPFAGSHFSRSTFKIKSDRDSYDLFSTGRKRRLTTLDGAKNQKAKLQDDTTSKFADPEDKRETMLTTFTQKGAYPINRTHHTPQSSLGKGENESTVNGASSLWVHNHRSTETAHKILSHLERATIPSSLEKPPLHRQTNREIPSRSLLLKNKMQESNQKMPDANLDGAASKSDTTATKQNSDIGGFGFTFPVPAVHTTSCEPPPTPTMPSPSALPVSVKEPAVPTFSFGSSGSSSRLVFSFGSADNTLTTLDEEPPTFTFGSKKKRLSFSFPENGAVCY